MGVLLVHSRQREARALDQCLGEGDQEMRPEKVLGGVAVVLGLSASSVQAMAFTAMGWQSRQGMKTRSSVVEELG